MKKIQIAIIDNGVYVDHIAFREKKPVVIEFSRKANGNDNGHGTAIYNIIRKVNSFADVINFNISDTNNEIEQQSLVACLENIYNNYQDIDIINISMGVNIVDDINQLQIICEKLSDRGTIIVCAFDNAGAISYPAGFESVIGVTNDPNCYQVDDFAYFEDNVVNIGAKGGLQRLAWHNPPYIFLDGNSFACAHVTVQTAHFMNEGAKTLRDILDKFKEKSIITYSNSYVKNVKKSLLNNIHKAVLFPFNKEMHSLIRFKDLLSFDIVAVYDSKYSFNIGSTTDHIMKSNVESYKIKSIKSIDWDTFDTIILGHLDKLSSLINQKTYVQEILDAVVEHNKQIFAFDNLYRKTDYAKLYCPVITKNNLPPYRMGKLFRISKPVVGVYGTSSVQGKFTLQLEMRKRFLDNGYVVGQIGTEPQSQLFGMDYSFPMGYNCSVYLENHEIIQYLNNSINELCKKNCDIILTGSQSSVLPYDIGNLRMFPLKQFSFLMGTQPDAVILCINPFDDDDYLHRSINVLEAAVNCKVIALCMFPMDQKNDWTGLYGQKVELSIDKYQLLKTKFAEKYKIPIYLLNNESDMDMLFEQVISYFSE